MFEDEIDDFEGTEFSNFFGRKRRRKSSNSRPKMRRFAKKAAGFYAPVAAYRFAKKRFGRSNFDAELD